MNPPTTGTPHFIETRPNSGLTDSDTVIYVYDSAGTYLCGTDYGETSIMYMSQLSLPLTTGATYYIQVMDYEEQMGYYSIGVNTTGFNPTNTGVTPTTDINEPDNVYTAAAALTVGGGLVETDLGGSLGGTDDEDWYSFTAQ